MGNAGKSAVAEPIHYRRPISEWPADDRPRERLLRIGPEHLSDAELIAILLRSGKKGLNAVDMARHLLSGDRTIHDLARMSPHALRNLGIGESRSVVLAATFEVARRVLSAGREHVAIHGPDDVEKIFGAKLRDLTQEEFWVLPLNSANKLLRPARVTIGTLNASLVHPRECFRPAIERAAAAVVFVHNHPSGNAEPSIEDLTITRQLVEAGKVLGIPVHDHVIISGKTYTSLAERGEIG